jgi:hypothetical protein
MYLLFIWGAMYGFGWGRNPLLGPFEGVGPEIETFLGPSKSIRPAPYKKTGTFVI